MKGHLSYDAAQAADRHAIDTQLAAVASAVGLRLAEVSGDVGQHLRAEIPQLRGDELLLNLLASSVEGNVETLLHVWAHNMALENTEGPAAAFEYARRLAQRDIPIQALVRAYRVGHGRFLQWCLDERADTLADVGLADAVTRRMLEVSFGYIDRVSERVISAYQQERDRWLLTQTAVRAGRVRSLLAGQRASGDSTDLAPGYGLRQNHVGLVSWVPEPTQRGEGLARLDRLSIAIGERLGCATRPLFVPCDESLAWSWLPMGSGKEFDGGVLEEAVLDTDPTAWIAVGEPGYGIEGFRRTHHQALGAQTVALTARPGMRVTTFTDVGPVALLCADPEATRSWVRGILGPLATNDEHHERLRGTLRVFLQAGGSFRATAEQLTLHKNTIQYRIRKAEEALGQPLRSGRADVELALRVCDQLGGAMLESPHR